VIGELKRQVETAEWQVNKFIEENRGRSSNTMETIARICGDPDDCCDHCLQTRLHSLQLAFPEFVWLDMQAPNGSGSLIKVQQKNIDVQVKTPTAAEESSVKEVCGIAAAAERVRIHTERDGWSP
jgi:hypothetical protein